MAWFADLPLRQGLRRALQAVREAPKAPRTAAEEVERIAQGLPAPLVLRLAPQGYGEQDVAYAYRQLSGS